MIAGSHHNPESFIIYIKKKIEKTFKNLALSEDRTPIVAEKC